MRHRQGAFAGIDVREVKGVGAMVTLPPLFWLMIDFRRQFTKAQPDTAPWTYSVPGALAATKVSEWAREREADALADQRRREQARRDAEWESLDGHGA